MEIRQGPRMFKLRTIGLINEKKSYSVIGVEGSYKMLDACDEKGHFPRKKSEEYFVRDEGPGQVTELRYRSIGKVNSVVLTLNSVVLTWEEFQKLGRPDKISEQGAYTASSDE